VNGKVFTIRLANHNAKVSNFDNHGENEGISIVVTAQDNNGINNDGNAHVVEFFYDAIKLRKADGKPLVEILKSIKQALYSGEYKDTTGLAQAEEVNIPEFMQVYHGSGAKFDKFDHSYMGSGEGAQAFGWGTYVTEVEGIGRAYANVAQKNILADEIVNNSYHIHLMEQNIERGMREIAENEAITSFENPSEKAKNKARIAQRKEYISYAQAEISKLKKRNEFLEKNLGDIIGNRVVYTIEIPNNDGSNYLNWERGERNDGAVERIAEGLQKEGFELVPNANHTTLERDGKRVVLNAHASGADLYAELSEGLGSDKAASEFLNRIGYVGIKYPTESLSGGNKDGKSNYVIFNEEDAQITDRVEFLRTADGVVYGWAVGGKVYLTKEGMNPNTPAHEYTHLWAQMVEKADPKLWGRIVDGLRGCATWNEVLNDKAYEGIWGDDSRMASEVLSRLTGAENYRREMARAQAEIADAKGVFDKAEKVSVWENVKQALRLFLDKVKSLILKGETIRSVESDVPAWMEFVDMALGDLYGGVNPGESGGKAELMFIGEKGAAAMDKTPHLTKKNVENNFGGIWIDDKQEYAKFVSAVNNYAFEEDGEGIAYTDDYFYAYYMNNYGQVIPYARVNLNAEDSQDVVNQVNQEIKDGRKDKRAKEYFDTAVARHEVLESQNNVNNGDNRIVSDRRRNVRLGHKLLQKGGYFDRPELYVKAQRTDRFELLEDDDALYRTSDEIDAQYPNWLDGTTTESGKHSTQVEGTRKTYNKVGTWIEEHLGKDVEILDASSGMGYGTADLRERGFNIEDVEPYQSAERKANNPATYSSYADIAK
jgi:hypothetical protein